MLAWGAIVAYLFLLTHVSFALPNQKSPFEDPVCNTPHPHITNLGQEAFKFGKPTKRQARKYLPYRAGVVDPDIARWQQRFFGSIKAPSLKPVRPIPPLRRDAPTIISVFYPDPQPIAGKDKSSYLSRIKNLAQTKEQVIIYVAQSVYDEVKAMRSDPHWVVIADWPTIWEVPNNKFQRNNFERTQPALFREMAKKGTRDFHPSAIYNRPFYSAIYNSKAFFIYDAALRNPFGSTKLIFMDGGLLRGTETNSKIKMPTEKGQSWDMLFGGFLDNAKLERSIRLTGNTGVVFPEYAESQFNGAPIDINSLAFHDPDYQWLARYFLGGVFAGSTQGMLNFAVRYMQSVDILEANNLYVGREEFVLPFTALLYPNTIFSMPDQPEIDERIPKGSMSWMYLLLSYSNWGKTVLPAIRDPLFGRYCGPHTKYAPRGQLEAGRWDVTQPPAGKPWKRIWYKIIPPKNNPPGR